jgi:hypothetical protein
MLTTWTSTMKQKLYILRETNVFLMIKKPRVFAMSDNILANKNNPFYFYIHIDTI